MNRVQSIAKAAALSEGLPLASGEPALFLFPLEGPHYFVSTGLNVILDRVY